MTEADWDGTERRVADNRLVTAIGEVRDLRDAAAKLADAVQVRTDEFQRVIQRVGMMLAALLVVLMAFSLWQVSRLNHHLDAGHDLLTCLLLIGPDQRTAQTLIDCQRGVG